MCFTLNNISQIIFVHFFSNQHSQDDQNNRKGTKHLIIAKRLKSNLPGFVSVAIATVAAPVYPWMLKTFFITVVMLSDLIFLADTCKLFSTCIECIKNVIISASTVTVAFTVPITANPTKSFLYLTHTHTKQLSISRRLTNPSYCYICTFLSSMKG